MTFSSTMSAALAAVAGSAPPSIDDVAEVVREFMMQCPTPDRGQVVQLLDVSETDHEFTIRWSTGWATGLLRDK